MGFCYPSCPCLHPRAPSILQPRTCSPSDFRETPQTHRLISLWAPRTTLLSAAFNWQGVFAWRDALNTPGGPNDSETNAGQRQTPCRLDIGYTSAPAYSSLSSWYRPSSRTASPKPAASIDGLTGHRRVRRSVGVQLQLYRIGEALGKGRDITQMFRSGFMMT